MIPRDFLIAGLLVLACNLLLCGAKPGPSARTISYNKTLGEIRRMDPAPPIDLVIHGDSRSRLLEAPALCAQLRRPLRRCENVSSTSGDWVTAWDLQEKVAPLLADDAIIILAVSDYWLEMGGRNAIGMIPSSRGYAALGDPLSTVESYLPISRLKSAYMTNVHEALVSVASGVGERFPLFLPESSPSSAPESPLPYGATNVDRWFRAAREDDLQEHWDRGSALIEQLTGSDSPRSSSPRSDSPRSGYRVALVYLPNPAFRDKYVRTTHPGRSEHFFESLRALASEAGVPVLDLSKRLPDAREYRDLHHLNERGLKKATRALARALDIQLSLGWRSDPQRTNP